LRRLVFAGFSWSDVDRQVEADYVRLKDHLSGLQPSTPNQYMLPDGRVFDAEAALYSARWLPTPADLTGGIIPQMFG
jgi:hypothetical protein